MRTRGATPHVTTRGSFCLLALLILSSGLFGCALEDTSPSSRQSKGVASGPTATPGLKWEYGDSPWRSCDLGTLRLPTAAQGCGVYIYQEKGGSVSVELLRLLDDADTRVLGIQAALDKVQVRLLTRGGSALHVEWDIATAASMANCVHVPCGRFSSDT